MKPSPVPTAHECSACGLDWKRHGEKPSLSKCVELLKAEVQRLKAPKIMTEAVGKPYIFTKTVGREELVPKKEA